MRMKLTHPNFAQDRDPSSDVAREQRVVESRHRVSPSVCDLLHFGQLVGAAGGEVQERETIEVFGLLVCFFDDL